MRKKAERAPIEVNQGPLSTETRAKQRKEFDLPIEEKHRLEAERKREEERVRRKASSMLWSWNCYYDRNSRSSTMIILLPKSIELRQNEFPNSPFDFAICFH